MSRAAEGDFLLAEQLERRLFQERGFMSRVFEA